MFREIKTVFIKELRRFFTDRRILAGLFLPGILLFVIYTIIGQAISGLQSQVSAVDNTQLRVAYTDNFGSGAEPELISNLESVIYSTSDNTLVIQAIAPDAIGQAKTDIREGRLDLLIVYSSGFEDGLETSQNNSISLFYDGSDKASSYVYNLAVSLVAESYNNYAVNIEDGQYVQPNLAEADIELSQVLSFVFPIVTVAMLFSAVMTICPESIAGEKERGTIASLLMTPVHRSSIALGKVFAQCVAALAGGAVSFLGICLSLPSMMFGMDLGTIFTPGVVIALLFLILTTLLLFVTSSLAISAFAKTVREANALVAPLMVVLMVLSIFPAFADMTAIGYAFIPLMNIMVSMNMVIMGAEVAVMAPYLAVTIVINILLCAGLVYVICRLFNSERAMFTK